MLKRYTAVSKRPVEVIASEPVVRILKHDPSFNARPRSTAAQGARSSLAIVRSALTGDLLQLPFLPIGTGAGDRQHEWDNVRVGVAWASIANNGKRIPEKSIPAENMLCLFAGIDASLISFQRRIVPDDEDAIGRVNISRLHSDVLGAADDCSTSRLMDIIRELNVMVSVSTTLAHVAAAAGRPVHLLAARRDGPQWFWQAQADYSKTLYPTVSIHFGGDGKNWCSAEFLHRVKHRIASWISEARKGAVL